MNKKMYPRYAAARSARSELFLDCLRAFFVGGVLCMIARAFAQLYEFLGCTNERAVTFSAMTLIVAAAVLSGIGVFDRIAKFAGAGTLVPITGFSNAIASVAIESKTEGFVLGVGAKIFTIAGPVILYGIAAGVLYGAVLLLV